MVYKQDEPWISLILSLIAPRKLHYMHRGDAYQPLLRLRCLETLEQPPRILHTTR